jgi:hypothetical protein
MTINNEFESKWKGELGDCYNFPSWDLSEGERGKPKKSRINVMCPVGNSNWSFSE